MDLLKRVEQFLERRWDKKSPLLLGYSGGPDSKALLYALLEAGSLPLHLAHVDHGWREESGLEAEELRKEAAALNLPLHTIRLTERPEGNWEEFGRAARLQFFRSLFEKLPFGALLLAHHGDDAAETSLKRVLEGAHLANLGGMREWSSLDGMEVWRPLLGVGKRDILSFLEAKSLEPLLDPTNEDPRFLRGRLRSEILPSLQTSFGKGIGPNLQQLSERSFELKEYLDRKIEPLWARCLEGPWGVCIDLGGVERIEARHALQAMGAKRGLLLSRQVLETWLDALQSRKPDVQLGGCFADRGRAFFLSEERPRFEEAIRLQEGEFTSGDWKVDIRPYGGKIPERGWKLIWQGHFEAALPDGYLQLPGEGPVFQEEWRKEGVPPFFRREIPIVVNGEKTFEFLTAKAPRESEIRWAARFSLHITR